MKVSILVTTCLLGVVFSDTYLTNPRGSNNRLNENTATRQNANRLFDSQNNNRGGYNTGDRYENAAGNQVFRQYSMNYYGSGATEDAASKMIVEWTNQHGCGGNKDSPHKTNCNIVIQMMCMNNGTDVTITDPALKGGLLSRIHYMRDGTDRQTQPYQEPQKNENSAEANQNTKNAVYNQRMNANYQNVQFNRGLHETVWWYDQCRYREANKGLYTADQNLNKNKQGYVDSSRTRQNNAGTRRGYECPEERDYYPYWAPTHQSEYETVYQRTPWIDLAYLTGNLTECNHVQQGSENQNSKWRCVLGTASARKYGRAITKEACEEEEGTWVEFHSYIDVIEAANNEAQCNTYAAKDQRNQIKWMPLRSDSTDSKCVVQAPLPKCEQAPWTRVNHLGNSIDSKGNASRWEAELPYFPSGAPKRCVLRLRYNITTDEFDNYGTDHRHNYDIGTGVVSPVEQDPYIDVAGMSKPLRLAMNTNQYGRTFQDRTHTFIVLPRTSAMGSKIIHNLNVRGKRGNIVQTFPAVEYDFIPNKLNMKKEDLLHIQWTGSNTHNNGGNGGDGQTGDAGEGTGGTDRSNFLEMQDSSLNYPVPFENSTFWDSVESVTAPSANPADLAVAFASSGYYCGYDMYNGCPAMYAAKYKNQAMNKQLNNAPASFFGHVLKFKKGGTFIYLCTRNNNFTNRSQKGVLWVS